MEQIKSHAASPVATLRQQMNMTQEEFAHAIGVTVSTVNRWENGHVAPSRLARKAMEGLALLHAKQSSAQAGRESAM